MGHMAITLAREYRRISRELGGHSIDEQADDNRRAADAHGWVLGAPYADPDRSASRYATRERDDFRRLVGDLESGTFGAEILILWESSRGSRRVGEWDRLLGLCERRDVKIHVTSHGRTYDPANHRDRRTLLEDAVDSAYESDKVSIRGRRTAASQAALGRPHGLAPYGLKPVYDAATRRLITWVEDEEVSIVPKELFRLLEAGHSLAAIERSFAERGFFNKNTGRPFTRHHLRNMATRAAYAGIRVHKGVEIPGAWDAIIPPERFYAVRRILGSPSRKTARNGAAKYELTMTLKCGPCGGPIHVTRANLKSGRESYTCRNSHVFIAKADVDAIVIPRILAYLGRPEIYAALTARSGDDAEVQQIRAELQKKRADRDEVEEATPGTLTEARILARTIEALDEEIARLEDRERGLTLPPALAGLLGVESVVSWWTDAPISARREVVRIVLSPELLGEVRILPVPRRGFDPVPAIDRIEWRRA